MSDIWERPQLLINPPVNTNNLPNITGNKWKDIEEGYVQKKVERETNKEKWGFTLPDNTYLALNRAVANNDISVDEGYKLAASLVLSQQYDLPAEYIRENFDQILRSLNAPAEGYRMGQTSFNFVFNKLRSGISNLEAGKLSGDLMRAEIVGDTKGIEYLNNRIKEIEEEQYYNSDPNERDKNFFVKALGAAAESAPFTLYVAASAFVGSLLSPGAGTAAAFTASMNVTRGQEYRALRNAGATIETARNVSLISGVIQSSIEIFLGNALSIAGGAAKTAGKNLLTDNVTRVLIEKATANAFKNAHGKGLFLKTALLTGGTYIGEILEEGLEELLQEWTSALALETANALQEGGVENYSADEIWHNMKEAFKSGAMASIFLGIPGTGMNARASVRSWQQVKSEAERPQSEQEFINRTKDSEIFSGLSDELKLEYQKAAYTEGQQRVQAEESRIATENRNRRLYGALDQSGNIYRNEQSRLYMEHSRHTESNGLTTGEFAAGDPHKSEKNSYAIGNYELRGDTVAITEFRIGEKYEGLQKEIFQNFANDIGKEIEYNGQRYAPTGEGQSLRFGWESENKTQNRFDFNRQPYTARDTQADIETKQQFAGQLRSLDTRLSGDAQINTVVDFYDTIGRKWFGMGFDSFMNRMTGGNKEGWVHQNLSDEQIARWVANDQGLITDAEAIKQIQVNLTEAQRKAAKENIRGFAVPGADGVTKAIYAAKDADVSTFVHEGVHAFTILAKELDIALFHQMMEAAGFKQEDYKNADKASREEMTRNAMETLAYGAEAYLKEGPKTVKDSALINLYDRIKEFLKDLADAVSKGKYLTPEVRALFDRLFGEEDINGQQKEFADRILYNNNFSIEEKAEILRKLYERELRKAKQAVTEDRNEQISDGNINKNTESVTKTEEKVTKNADTVSGNEEYELYSEDLLRKIKDKSLPEEIRCEAAVKNAELEMLPEQDRKHGPTAELIKRARRITDPALQKKVIKEIRELRNRYAGTKAEFKAPNAKESLLLKSLGEEKGREAWYTVRFENFQNWFGDWETAARIEAIKDIEAQEVKPGETLTKKEAEALISNKKLINKNDGRKADIPVSTIGKIISHKGYNTAQLIKDIPALYEKSLYGWSETENNNEEQKRHTNIKRYHHYINKFNDGINDYFIRFTLHEENTKRKKEGRNLIHSAAISDIAIYKKTMAPVVSGTINPGVKNSSSFIDNKLIQFFDSVNPDSISKVVDENGEPKVVYHGTPNKFEIFDRNKGKLNDAGWLGEGHYFYGDINESTGYARGTGNIMACFLNVKEPYYLSVEENRDLSEHNDRDYSKEHSEGVKDEGYDGVYYNGDLRQEWMVFNSNQIKSATGNIGTFDPLQDNIYFQIIGEQGAAALDKAEELTHRLDYLNIVRQMEEAKKDAMVIRAATGWEREADGKWRYEIPDIEINEDGLKRINKTGLVNLKDLVIAEDLFKAYPDIVEKNVSHIGQARPLKNYTVRKEDSNKFDGGFSKSSKTISIAAYYLENKTELLKNVLIHKIQHTIQEIEGFAEGGDPNILSEEKYHRVAGEVEARNAQSRSNMSVARRAYIMLEATEDIARKDQIFIKEGIYFQAAFHEVNITQTFYSEAFRDAGLSDFMNSYPEVVKEAARFNSGAEMAEYYADWFAMPDEVFKKARVLGYFDAIARAAKEGNAENATNAIPGISVEKAAQALSAYGINTADILKATSMVRTDDWQGSVQLLESRGVPRIDAETYADTAKLFDKSEMMWLEKRAVKTINLFTKAEAEWMEKKALEEENTPKKNPVKIIKIGKENPAIIKFFNTIVEGSKEIYPDSENEKLRTELAGEERTAESFVNMINTEKGFDDLITRAFFWQRDGKQRGETDEETRQNEAIYDRVKAVFNPNNGNWKAAFENIATGKKVNEHTRKIIRGMVRNRPLQYMDTWAMMTGDDTWLPEENDIKRIKRLDTEGLVDEEYLERQSPEELERIGRRLSSDRIKKKIDEKTLLLDDPDIAEYEKQLKEDMSKAQKLITEREGVFKEYRHYLELAKSNAKKEQILLEQEASNTSDTGLKASRERTKELSKAHQQVRNTISEMESFMRNDLLPSQREAFLELRKQLKERERINAELKAIEEIRKIKIRNIRNILRKPDLKTVSLREAKYIDWIQAHFDSYQAVAKFIGRGAKNIRQLYNEFAIDAEYREKLKNKLPPLTYYQIERTVFKDFAGREVRAYGSLDARQRKVLYKHLIDYQGIFEELGIDILAEPRKFSKAEWDAIRTEMQDFIPADVLIKLEGLINKDKNKNRLFKVENFNIEDLQTLAGVVNRLRKDGRERESARKDAKAQLRIDGREKVIKTLESNMPKNAAKSQMKGIASTRMNEGKRSGWKGVWLSLHNARRFFRRLEGGKDGYLYDFITQREYDAFDQENNFVYERRNKVEKELKEAGIDLKELGMPNRFTLYNGQPVSLDEMISFYYAQYNERALNAVMFGNFASQQEREAFKALGSQEIKEQLDKEEVIAQRYWNDMKKLEAFFAKEGNEKYRKVMEIIGRDYDDNYERLKEFVAREYNEELGSEPYYMPLIRQGVAAKESDKFEQAMADTGMTRYVNKGMTKSRVDIPSFAQQPIQAGMYTLWDRMVVKQEHLMAYDSLHKELRQIFQGDDSETLRDTLRRGHSEAAVKYVEKFISELAAPPVHDNFAALDKVNRIMQGHYPAAVLGGRIASIVKQAIESPPPFFQYVYPWQYAAAGASCLKQETRDMIREKSTYMKTRYFDPAAAVVNEMEKMYLTGKLGKVEAVLSKIESKSMWLQGWIDSVCVMPGWLAAYNKKLSELNENNSDMTVETADAQAVRYADQIVRDCQPSSILMDQAQLLKGEKHPLAKMFMQFQTPIASIFQQLFIDAPINFKQGRVLQGLWTWGIYALLAITIGAMHEDEDDEDFNPKNRGIDALVMPISMIPIFGGDMSYAAESFLRNGKIRTPRRSNFPVFDQGIRFVNAISDEKWDKAGWEALKGFMYYAGLPVAALQDIEKAIQTDKPQRVIGIK